MTDKNRFSFWIRLKVYKEGNIYFEEEIETKKRKLIVGVLSAIESNELNRIQGTAKSEEERMKANLDSVLKELKDLVE